MIYTVTLNPSIDFIVRIDKVEIGEVNRMESDDKFAGGKGINVSRILQRLGIDNTATGFIGGFTGRFVTDSLDAEGIKTKFVAVDQDTRINVKIKADQETEINGTGPVINDYQLAELEAILSSVSADDVVVFAGSAPSNLGNKVYNKLIPLVRETGAQVVCDFEGQTLLDSLVYQPLLVKPNNHELGEIFGVELKDRQSVIPYGKKLQKMGAVNVLISMAGEGAVLIAENGDVYEEPAPKGKLINGVGAGDSMVAGFMAGYMEKQDYEYAFHMGIAAGSASAFSENLATREEIEAVYQQITGKDQEERKK